MSQEVIMIMGIQGSGKSVLSQQYIDKGYVYLNRDTIGCSMDELEGLAMVEITSGRNVVLDNTYPTIESRKNYIKLANIQKAPIKCIWKNTSIEEAQVNVARRIINKIGRLPDPNEMKKHKDPAIVPPVALFTYRKIFEEPTLAEGFASIEVVEFKREHNPTYTNKALILDYDGTLRKTKSGAEYPVDPADIEVLPGRTEKLKEYAAQGYRLLGVSNQSGVAKGLLTMETAKACFEQTNKLLGLDIDYTFCPHQSAPISCYCRKPMPGRGVEFIEKYKLDPRECVMIGDLKTDETFAKRSGFRYFNEAEFFAVEV